MSTRWTRADIPDQTGRVAVVTGGNSGLGLETCRALAEAGATVVMGCRTIAKGDAARSEILSTAPDAAVEVQHLDVASLASVAAAAAEITDRHPAIDLLVNNAGIMATPRGRTEDGFESQLGTNHLGHFALTGHLLDALTASRASRVVHVSSLAARNGRMHWDDLMLDEGYDPLTAYNQSKLANQLFAYALHRRVAAHNLPIASVAAHPGLAKTNLLGSTVGGRVLHPLIMPLVGLLWNTASRGALPQLYAATAPDAQPGGYYGPDGAGERRGWPTEAFVPRRARSEDDQDRLWVASEERTGVRYLSDL